MAVTCLKAACDEKHRDTRGCTAGVRLLAKCCSQQQQGERDDHKVQHRALHFDHAVGRQGGGVQDGEA